MANRPASFTEADLKRAINACRKAGLPITRVVVKGDRVEIESGKENGEVSIIPVDGEDEVVL